MFHVRKKVFGRREQSEAVPPLYRPYKSDHVNKVYNLLFCDNLSLLTERNERDFSFNTVMSESVDRETLERIGNDLDVESRVRVVAFNRLRAMKLSVPTKRLLGVIIETPQPGGLDVLAAFPDGCLRYINFSEKFALLNSPTPSLAEKSAELIRVSQFIVNSIGPWNKVRRPPPQGDLIRMSFLVSDGLYFGEGPYLDLARDRLAAPVLKASHVLLEALVDYVLAPENKDQWQ